MHVPDTNDNYTRCLCYSGRCPTYNENTLDGGLFCARGKHPKNPEGRTAFALTVRCGSSTSWEISTTAWKGLLKNEVENSASSSVHSKYRLDALRIIETV